MSDMPGQTSETYIDSTSIVDDGAVIGHGCRIWHFCHVMGGATIGDGCTLGQNVMIADGVSLGRNVKVQNNVSVYSGVTVEDNVFLGPSCVFTNVRNPRSEICRRGQYERTLVREGATIGGERHDKVWCDDRAVWLCGGRQCSYCRCSRLCRGDRRSGAAFRLDEPIWRVA